MEALKREPLAVRTALSVLVAAIVHLAVLFGVDLDPAGEGSIVATVDAAVALVIIFTVRPKVTPVDSPTLTVDQVATGNIYAGPDSDYELIAPVAGETPGSFTISPKPE